jgi:hypothetical protein
MPRADAMTYVPARKRWTKMFKGQRFWISCQALGAPETKDGSRQAANAWWQTKENELRGLLPCGSPERRRAILQAYKGRPIAPQEILPVTAEYINSVSHADNPQQSYLMYELLGKEQYERAVEACEGREKQDALLASAIAGEASIEDSAQSHVDAWLAIERLRVSNGHLSAGSYDNYQRDIKGFIQFIGQYASAKTINEDTVKGFFAHLQDQSNKVAKWTTGKAFIRHLAEQRTIEQPGNLDSRKFRFGQSEPKQQTWSMAQWQEAYQASEGLNRLCLLLAANCGFYGADISEAYNHFNASNGTITMARVKTEARTVTWVLWQETADLMVKHGQELSGLWGKTLDDNGKQKKRVASCIRGLKQLRHTSNSFVKNNPELGQYADYFLGQSAKSINERHYSAINLETSKRIADYLHSQYFAS